MSDPSVSAVDFGRSGISRYIQLATLFRDRIESGYWELGSQIPTVEDLANECGVARATIRQALDILENDGLIERFRAKGTFVRRRTFGELWCSVGTDWSGMLRSNANARIEVLSDEPDIKLDYIPYQIGTLAPSYRRLRRRHWRDDRPFLLTTIHIDERFRHLVTQEDVETKTAMRLIHDLEGVEITDAQQTLTIGSAGVRVAAALSIPLNAPLANIYRRAVDADGITILVAEGVYRGDVVRLDIKLR